MDISKEKCGFLVMFHHFWVDIYKSIVISDLWVDYNGFMYGLYIHFSSFFNGLTFHGKILNGNLSDFPMKFGMFL